jgi:hypothetical protein
MAPLMSSLGVPTGVAPTGRGPWSLEETKEFRREAEGVPRGVGTGVGRSVGWMMERCMTPSTHLQVTLEGVKRETSERLSRKDQDAKWVGK